MLLNAFVLILSASSCIFTWNNVVILFLDEFLIRGSILQNKFCTYCTIPFIYLYYVCLFLFNVFIKGSIPSVLSALTLLYFLELDNNLFTGRSNVSILNDVSFGTISCVASDIRPSLIRLHRLCVNYIASINRRDCWC